MMALARTLRPFRFVTQANLVKLTGRQARDLRELAAYLEQAPPSVIYFHTHHFLKQHQFLSPEPPNDFAYWVTNVLQEDRLGEQLAAIDTVRFGSIRELGRRITELIQRFLETQTSHRSAPEGEEFHFRESIGFLLPTPYAADDLPSFVTCIKKVTAHSIYHHIFESRLRLEKGENDFSNWLKNELSETGLARAIARLDPYSYTSEGLRDKIIGLINARIDAEGGANHRGD